MDGPGFSGRRFLVDSGAELTHVALELAAAAGIATGDPLAIAGLTPDSARGVETGGGTLMLGGAQLRFDRAAALPSSALAGADRPFDGIIGRDLFAAYVVEIDYEQRLIRLHDPRTWHPPEAALPLALSLIGGKPYVQAALHLSDGTPLPALLQLDTGFGGAIGISRGFAEAQDLLARMRRHIPSSLRGVGGEAPARLGRIAGLALGKLVLPEPLVTVALAEGAGVRADAAGRIGGALLRRFRISFDHRRATAYLEPNASFARVLEVDMSGLSLVPDGGIAVARVARGSPAADAGIEAGDRLLELDGRPAASLGIDAVRAAFFEAGAVRTLLLSRRGRVFTAALRLRRRI